MNKYRMSVIVIIALAAAAPALADWDPGEQHKMHFAQLPDPNGWDVRNYNNMEAPEPVIVADDWTCSHSGFVTDIHIWGSWRGDPQQPHPIANIHLEIWDDDRTGPYSKPGMKLWEADFPSGMFAERLYGDGDQGWFDPLYGQFNRPDHTGIWQYNFTDIQNAFNQEKGTIYWLVASFELVDPVGMYEYGWKTSLDHWEDVAVWSPDYAEWLLLEDPETMQPLSLAFVIGGLDNELDFGDAPDPTYPTLLASDGARHAINQGPILGAVIDPEADGQPDPIAFGDDNNNLPDEDGIVYNTSLVAGQTATVTVTATLAPGFVNGWIDFNADGDWADAGEQILADVAHPGAGPVQYGFSVPAGAVAGMTFSRFRICTYQGLTYTGYAPDGEVEDHPVDIEDQGGEELDFGDAPDQPYPTLLASDGARHFPSALFLGASLDVELDGQPDPNALGDDNDGNDDEDGVIFSGPFIPGQTTTITVTVSGACALNGWIDYNGSGSWADAGEQVFVDVPLPGPGSYNLPVTVPASAVVGQTFSRFRISAQPGLSYTGFAADGEVEDYEIMIEESGVEEYDFGDAIDPTYPTLLASNGANHLLDGVTFLGASVDAEADGLPDPLAMGDDSALFDDEDGVVFTSIIAPGTTATVDVTASVAGLLDAWVDFYANGDWADPNENILISFPLNPGVNSIPFPVPADAEAGYTVARFRFSTVGGLPFDGMAPDGEVEDHILEIAIFVDGFESGDTSAWTTTIP